MSISVNGQSCVPPGFRFHPTEEELLNYYLKKKVAAEKIDLDVIRDVDLNKLEPWDIQEKCKIGTGPQNDWYFFSHKDKKYPTGTRTNRATAAGFWKATGRDKAIYNSFKRIGMRKTLVFYKGRAPHGQKSDWIMHEYRLDDVPADVSPHAATVNGAMASEGSQEEGWVVCRVFKKKHHHKDAGSSGGGKVGGGDGHAKAHMLHSASDDTLDQILQYMGRSCKQEHELGRSGSGGGGGGGGQLARPTSRYLRPIETVFGSNGLAGLDRFMKLPALESPSAATLPASAAGEYSSYGHAAGEAADDRAGITDWAMMDRLVASHLNGQSEASKQLASCFDVDDPASLSSLYCTTTTKLLGDAEHDSNGHGGVDDIASSDEDLWIFARSASSAPSSDRHSHVSL